MMYPFSRRRFEGSSDPRGRRRVWRTGKEKLAQGQRVGRAAGRKRIVLGDGTYCQCSGKYGDECRLRTFIERPLTPEESTAKGDIYHRGIDRPMKPRHRQCHVVVCLFSGVPSPFLHPVRLNRTPWPTAIPVGGENSRSKRKVPWPTPPSMPEAK